MNKLFKLPFCHLKQNQNTKSFITIEKIIS